MTKDRFFAFASIAGVSACLLGLFYLYAAGAPASMLFINGGALVLGLLLALLLKFGVQITPRAIAILALFGAISIFATAIFGSAIADARRWFLVGPFFVQTSSILLPLVAICFARMQNGWTTLAILIAALAVAIQPDRAMAGMLFLATSVTYWIRPGKWTASAAVFTAVSFAATLLLPDQIPAVPFVDYIIWTAFEVSLPAGLAIWTGCLMILGAILLVPKKDREIAHYVFTACWFALIAAAALGAYPTPLVGYGSSAIIGYFLSVMLAGSQREIARSGQSPDQNQTDKTDSFAKMDALSAATS